MAVGTPLAIRRGAAGRGWPAGRPQAAILSMAALIFSRIWRVMGAQPVALLEASCPRVEAAKRR